MLFLVIQFLLLNSLTLAWSVFLLHEWSLPKRRSVKFSWARYSVGRVKTLFGRYSMALLFFINMIVGHFIAWIVFFTDFSLPILLDFNGDTYLSLKVMGLASDPYRQYHLRRLPLTVCP